MKEMSSKQDLPPALHDYIQKSGVALAVSTTEGDAPLTAVNGAFCTLTGYTEDEVTGPINLGNPDEFTIRQLAEQVRARINPELPLLEKPLPADDPRQRQPQIALAQSELGWAPSVRLEQGLEPTIAWFKSLLEKRTHQS